MQVKFKTGPRQSGKSTDALKLCSITENGYFFTQSHAMTGYVKEYASTHGLDDTRVCSPEWPFGKTIEHIWIDDAPAWRASRLGDILSHAATNGVKTVTMIVSYEERPDASLPS